MAVYLTFYTILTAFASIFHVSRTLHYRSVSKGLCISHFTLLCMALSIFVGLRHQVGGDWNNYINLFELTRGITISSALKINDPGYYLLNWFASNKFGGIYLVNYVCAALFVFGIWRLLYEMPDRYSGLAYAFPYLVCVVGMGYTRQSAALGLTYLALTSISQKNLIRFFFFIILASAFHKSAALFSLIAFSRSKSKKVFIFTFVSTLSGFYLVYELYLSHYVLSLHYSYIENVYRSNGAIYRTAIHAVFGLLYLIWFKTKEIKNVPSGILVFFSYLSFLSFALAITLDSNVFVDRLALYLFPLDLLVISNLSRLIQPKLLISSNKLLQVILGLNLILFVLWLKYSPNSEAWSNYKIFPFI